ncbi:guanine nucleotide-binding protein-like 3 homolog [Parasteatoda tepidariorum]|uniref:guanine nucleotide-binding protein-like 3 homolog n=1 Tax=Parasteatoda tepidariorum TaxID=114398 RepID=UPI00077FC1D0|nr:FK506-binding protein 4 [Parasteatoda tepidariorum]
MDTCHYNSLLSKSLFIDSKNDSNEDSTTDEEIDVGEEDPVPTEREYAVESEEEEEDSEDDDDDDEEDSSDSNKFIRKRIVPMVPARSRQNGRTTKTVKKKRNHNNMERVRREKVSMCYAVLRSAIGVKDVSRNKSLEVATDLINKYNARLREVDQRIEDYENKIKNMMVGDAGMMPTQNNGNKYARR